MIKTTTCKTWCVVFVYQSHQHCQFIYYSVAPSIFFLNYVPLAATFLSSVVLCLKNVGTRE